MRIRIPQSFHLLGHTVTVKIIAAADWTHGDDVVGIWNPPTHEIYLHGDLSGSRLEQTFFHELDHAILHTMGHKLAYNEPFVDAHASLLHQALSGARYPRKRKAGCACPERRGTQSSVENLSGKP